LEAAIRGFRALPQNKPVADELYYLGSAYFRRRDTQQATQTLERAAASKPGDYRVRLLLARCYEKLGRKAEAERQYALSEKIRENYRGKSQAILGCHSALFTQFPQDPGPGVERCHELLDGDDPTKLVSLGVFLAERGLYAQAVAPLVKAAQLDPENYEPYFNLGLTYFKMKDYGNARKSLEAAVALRSESYEAVALLGSALFALGDDFNAVKQLRHAHELRPSDEKISAMLFEELKIIAQHLRAEKQYKQSIPYFEEALSLRPGAAELHSQLAEVYRALGGAASATKDQQASDTVP
jgi:Flp pilus assembly protein TadD